MNLVTGATGIVGSHVVLALLQSNQPVTACRRKSSDLSNMRGLFAYYTPDYQQLFEKIKWVETDLQDIFSIEDALEGIDTVYHCAGFVSFDKQDKRDLFAINENGTRNVVNACLSKGNTRLCHVSSIAAINNLDYRLPLSEEVFWKRSGRESDYAISKYNAEREVWRGIEEGLQAVIVNPGVILSPGFRGQSSAKLFDLGKKGSRFYTPGSTGYIAAHDVARAMLELVAKKQFGQRFILIENNYTFRHIFAKIQGCFGKPSPSVRLSKNVFNIVRLLLSLAARIQGKRAPISKAVMHAAYHDQSYSPEKAKRILSFSFTPVDEVLEQVCGFMQREHR